jgi:hypothetical protein
LPPAVASSHVSASISGDALSRLTTEHVEIFNENGEVIGKHGKRRFQERDRLPVKGAVIDGSMSDSVFMASVFAVLKAYVDLL